MLVDVMMRGAEVTPLAVVEGVGGDCVKSLGGNEKCEKSFGGRGKRNELEELESLLWIDKESLELGEQEEFFN